MPVEYVFRCHELDVIQDDVYETDYFFIHRLSHQCYIVIAL